MLEAVSLSEPTQVLSRPARPQGILASSQILSPLPEVVVLNVVQLQLWQCIRLEVQKRTWGENGHLNVFFYITQRPVVERDFNM